MNKLEEQKLVGLFQVTTSVQKQLDARKRQISANHSNITALINNLSHGHKTIRIDSFMEHAKKIIACSDQQLYCVFCRLDTKRRGYIAQNDIFNFVGKTNEHNANLQSQFDGLLLFLICSQRKINAARDTVSNILPYHAYDTIDTNRVGHIGQQNIRKFMANNHCVITKPEATLLCYAIRRYVCRPINLEVFCEFLNPLEFGPYEAYAAELQKIETEKYLSAERKNNQKTEKKRRNIAAKKSQQRWDDINLRFKESTDKQEDTRLHEQLAKEHERQLRLERRMQLDFQKRVRINQPYDQMEFEQQAYNNLQERLNLAREQEALLLEQRLSHLLQQQSNLKNMETLDELSRLEYQNNLCRMDKHLDKQKIVDEVESAANSYFQKPINKILDRTAASSAFGRSRSYMDEQLQLVEMELEARRQQMTFQEKVREQIKGLQKWRWDIISRPI